MSEAPVLFGSTGSLVGIVTEPEGALESAGRPAVVLLNAGDRVVVTKPKEEHNPTRGLRRPTTREAQTPPVG